MAVALREAFDGKAVVLTPDLPRHPKEALKLVRKIIDKECPDLLIGNSCGAFLVQMLALWWACLPCWAIRISR